MAAGGRVAILDLNAELGQKLRGELGDAARYVRADVSLASEAEEAVKAAVAAFGTLNICVNCAGIGSPQRIITKEGPGGSGALQPR